ncbi:50S ribosomal protein L24 [Methanobrevibacter sp. 87.7]|uniref:50S ribosomal protein L24 n=1 Tax=Methanobrevibacter sp. 87.7 TaxID=387957 RepID=UPI000B50EA2E|nr:50S ribosomal protein L24 [Methanobrevibacter sp. 87.7]OWT33681.1 50S ribosomal protein L24 [Methanobrevibacter sp. 87.7]
MTKQPRKQRRNMYKAPKHQRHARMAATLSKDLRQDLGKRSLPVRVGDKVKVLRGDFKDQEGKIEAVNYKKYTVSVEGVTLNKADGTTIYLPIHPSNLMIVDVDLDDERRIKVSEEE